MTTIARNKTPRLHDQRLVGGDAAFRRDFLTPDRYGRSVHSAVFYPNEDLTPHNGRPGIVMAPGYTEGTEVMSRFATDLAANEGQTVVLLDHHRDRERGELPQDHKVHSLFVAAEAYCDIFPNAETYELLAHSEGGIHAIRVAAWSERVTALTGVAPAGLAEQSFPIIACGAIQEVAGNFFSRSLTLGQAHHMARYLLANPLLSFEEALSIPATDVIDDLERVRDKDIPHGIIGFKRDRLIPAGALERSLPRGVPFRKLDTDHVNFLRNRKTGRAVYDIHKQFAARLPRPEVA